MNIVTDKFRLDPHLDPGDSEYRIPNMGSESGHPEPMVNLNAEIGNTCHDHWDLTCELIVPSYIRSILADAAFW